jgi:hypothetical protein
MPKRETDTKSIHYYPPSQGLANFLTEELRSLTAVENVEVAGGDGEKKVTKSEYNRKGSRKEKNNLAKYKNDYFRIIFQHFIDIIYFLEFVEDHPEMHELYEDNLKELFGYNIDDDLPQTTLDKDRINNLFHRFLSASLFNKHYRPTEIDFRVDLANVAMKNAFRAMERGLGAKKKVIINGNKEILIERGDPNELQLFSNNIMNAGFWGELISNRYQEPNLKRSNHRIGYSFASTRWKTVPYYRRQDSKNQS